MMSAEPEYVGTAVRIGVVTVSDRAFRGIYADQGGPGIEAALTRIMASPWFAVRRLAPDERPAIEAALCELADVDACPLIATTGGTGPSPRDVTPEATEAVCDRVLPGFGELMRAVSLHAVPMAILSRQLAGAIGAYVLLLAAALLRVFGNLAGVGALVVLMVAALCWVAAFLLILAVYAPMLLGPRADGKPG
jgi:molybdopterin adenylyltransferase